MKTVPNRTGQVGCFATLQISGIGLTLGAGTSFVIQGTGKVVASAGELMIDAVLLVLQGGVMVEIHLVRLLVDARNGGVPRDT